MNDDKLYLIHINECIDRIEQYTEAGKEAFLSDYKTQDAVLRNLQILAESSQRLSSVTKDNHSEIDWRGLSGFRNVLAHEYLGINLSLVWKVIEHDLPKLKRKIGFILSK